MPYGEPWHVSEDDYPAAGEPEEKLRFMLNYAVLAPLRAKHPTPALQRE